MYYTYRHESVAWQQQLEHTLARVLNFPARVLGACAFSRPNSLSLSPSLVSYVYMYPSEKSLERDGQGRGSEEQRPSGSRLLPLFFFLERFVLVSFLFFFPFLVGRRGFAFRFLPRLMFVFLCARARSRLRNSLSLSHRACARGEICNRFLSRWKGESESLVSSLAIVVNGPLHCTRGGEVNYWAFLEHDASEIRGEEGTRVCLPKLVDDKKKITKTDI